MAEHERTSLLQNALGLLLGLFMSLYSLGFIGSAVYFNWQYGQKHGFMDWLVFGEVVATGKAVAWPYFVFYHDTGDRPPELPRSAANFFFALDALAKANSPDQVGQPPDPSRVMALLGEAIDSSRSIDRSELNAIYPQLGDHFLDDAIGTATLILEAAQFGDQDKATRSMAAWIRWTQWYNPRVGDIVKAFGTRYNLEVR